MNNAPTKNEAGRDHFDPAEIDAELPDTGPVFPIHLAPSDPEDCELTQ